MTIVVCQIMQRRLAKEKARVKARVTWSLRSAVPVPACRLPYRNCLEPPADHQSRQFFRPGFEETLQTGIVRLRLKRSLGTSHSPRLPRLPTISGTAVRKANFTLPPVVLHNQLLHFANSSCADINDIAATKSQITRHLTFPIQYHRNLLLKPKSTPYT